MRLILVSSFLLISVCSCVSMRKNKDYSKDFNSMNKDDFAKKYFTLYGNQKIDFSILKKEKPYITYKRNSTFQIVTFCSDGYIYESLLMPISMINEAIPSQEIKKSNLYSIENEVIKFEKIAASPGYVYSIIEEGEVKGDTIFMKKKYRAKGFKNNRKLFNKYFLFSKIKVYKMGNRYFIESK